MMVKWSEHKKDILNIMDPDWNGMETLQNSDSDNQLDMAPLHQFDHQLKVDIEVPNQLSSNRCYGRGKKLEDIVVPRIPKIFLDDWFPAADVSPLSKIWQNFGMDTRHHGIQRHKQTIGRGKMLQVHSVSDEKNLLTSQTKEMYEEVQGHLPPAKPALVISHPKKSKSLIDCGTDFDFFHRPVEKTSFCVESREDFPSLSAGSSLTSSPVRRIHRVTSEPRNLRDSGAEEISSVFEDAEENPQNGPSCGSSRIADVASKFSDAVFSHCGSVPANMVVNENVEARCTNNYSQVSKSEKSSVNNFLCSDALKLTKAEKNECEDSGKISLDTARDASPMDNNKGDDIVKVCTAQQKKEDISAEDRITLLEDKVSSKAKKKSAGGWKLEGAHVVHVGNVPKGCGDELRHCMSNFGKVLDSEKKCKKGVSTWRYRFETKAICDYVVDCLHGAELFDGQPSALECYCIDGPEDGASIWGTGNTLFS